MAQQTGRVTIKLDGTPLRSKPGASMQMGGINRDHDMTDQGETLFKEKYVNGMMKCVMPHLTDTDVEKIRNFKNGTCQYTTDTNVTFTMAKASYSSSGELQNGELEVTFMGAPIQQG